MKNLKEKVTDYLEQPTWVNLMNFCNQYIELTNILWELTDEEDLKTINEALQQVLVKIKMGEVPNKFLGLSSSQIKAVFDQSKIELFESIPNVESKKIRDRLDKFILNKIIYAQKLQMSIPGSHSLTIKQYYENYKIAKEALPAISIRAGKGLK